ncbi:5'-AMP-activated protein kinase, catalytic alpha subunit [Angomonas deanei]|nr:5'-AMP-activated protein kinase, catalytic alpha subunit [Angomonas deanei]|eukprot:EPY38906.1 5'-AMP-activated protein kinase, catalytic alpha subunit [Angomonas deanei]
MDRNKSSQRFGPYQVGETIGRGTFAKVKIAVHESTKVRVALKIIPRKLIDNDAHSALKIKREIKIMKVLRHPHITRLYDVVQTKHDIVLAVEYVSGGELFDYISRKGRLEEPVARSLFQQLVAALAYCHQYRVTHRDIKPENIMMEQGSHNIKLSDFGLSSVTHDGRFFETSCGTPNYASPEVVSGTLYGGPEADVWSTGVVLYAMLCGTLPFDDNNVANLFRKIQTASYSVPHYISGEARDLLNHMLVVNPLERATMEQIMQHPWVRPHYPQYLLSLHYEAVVQTMQFARDRSLEDHTLDDEVINVVASRFRVSPEVVAEIVRREELSLPSMEAVILDERSGATRRYPAALYFETFSNVLDSKMWPTPLEVLPAEVALRDESHDMFISYLILTQKKQSKLCPDEYSHKNYGENASSLIHNKSLMGYGSLNANSLHQLSGNSSFTGSSLKETLSVTSPTGEAKKCGDKTFETLPPQSVVPEPQPTTVEQPWEDGYNITAAPFLPLKMENSKHTLLGSILKVSEFPTQLLQAKKIDTNAAFPDTSTTPTKSTLLKPHSEGVSPTRREPNTALESLYHVDTVTRFGNDFIRNGIAFRDCHPHTTLAYTYAAMKEEGLMWRVIYDYYFSAVRYPNVKLQVKIYKVTATEQLVDVKVSVQSGMNAYDVAISLLERLRRYAIIHRNNVMNAANQ